MICRDCPNGHYQQVRACSLYWCGISGEYHTGDQECAPVYQHPKHGIVFVARGLGEKYGTFWRYKTGALRRVSSPDMPMVADRQEAQNNLNEWAKLKSLKAVEVSKR